MSKPKAAEPEALKASPQGGIEETNMIGGKSLRRDPATLRPTAAEEIVLPGKHQPLHVFTEPELAEIEAGTATKEEILERVAKADNQAALVQQAEKAEETRQLKMAEQLEKKLDAAAPQSLEDLSDSLLDWVNDYIGRSYPGVAVSILLPEGGLAAPLLFIPIARGGTFGFMLEPRGLPEGMDAGTAARMAVPLTETLRRFSMLGYRCAVAVGEQNAQDKISDYMQLEETQRP